MKVKIMLQLAYQVETEEGGYVGDFIKSGEWQGMTHLTAGQGENLIVDSIPFTEEMVSRLLNGKLDPISTPVIKASPDVLNKIHNNPQY